jgi:uncharacterized protein YwgA
MGLMMASEMKRRDLILAIVAVCGERPEFGRTSLQKTAFFAAEVLGTEFGHKAHFYGPFSDDVEADVEDLVFTGLLSERVTTLGFAGPSGREAKKYDYQLTDEGLARVDALRTAYPEEFRRLEAFVVRLTESAGGLDQGILSPAAKTYFIAKREKRAVSPKEIRQFGASLGWDLKPAQIRRVSDVLDSLGLAKVERRQTGSAPQAERGGARSS